MCSADPQRAFGSRTVALSRRTFSPRSFSKPIDRIESLRPTSLRFRVLLGSDDAAKLEVVIGSPLRRRRSSKVQRSE